MKILKMTIAAAALLVTLVGCDEVDVNDRIIELPAAELGRTVLLEEYTGQKCINCPNAHSEIEKLIEQYPDNFISVSIHGGGDSNSIGEGQFSNRVGLRTDESEAYVTEAGIKSFPAGILNRTSGVLTFDKWAGVIRSELERPAHVDIEISAAFNADSTEMKIGTTLTSTDLVKGNLQLWIVESGIVAQQMKPDGTTDRRYVHNHVFRSTVNGMKGEYVEIPVGSVKTTSHTIALKDNWDASNLKVVGFVYDNTGVLQAAQTHVGEVEN